MLPLNDTEPSRYGSSLPLMTLTLIALNTAVLVLEMVAPSDATFMVWLRLYGSTPRLVLGRVGGGALSAVTSTFLHAGPFHLAGNMLFLWVFGRRVEDACGPWRFAAFYLLAGTVADAVSTLIRGALPGAGVPSIGASGAISGVMGAYLLLYPGGRIRTLIFLWLVPVFPRIRAFWFLFYWLGVQLLASADSLLGRSTGGTNYWAHVGGFFSCFFVFLFLRPEAFERYFHNVSV